MNKEEIDKWLDEEYGCSYTRLEKLHDFYFEKYTDLKKENKQLKEELKATKEVVEEHLRKEIQYKEVIEEVREEVKKSSLEVNTREYGMLTVCNSDDLLQILDKGVDR